MEILSLITTLFGGEKQLSGILENLLKDDSWLVELLKKADKDTINVICITILALKSGDSGILGGANIASS
jgi:hypothetical protein